MGRNRKLKSDQISRFKCPGTELNRYDRCGSQDFKSCVSTSSTTGACGNQKKNPPAETDGLVSGRPGSNRPPRPWQGRALPNELLPLIIKPIKELEGCKNKQRALLKKIFEPLICTWEYIKCFPELSPEASQTA